MDNNLAYLNPELAKEWHPTKNGDLRPEEVGLGSPTKVWWKCESGEDHEWKTSVSKRSSGQNCPYCSNKKIGTDNNLAYLNPELAKEWHPTKNGDLQPDEVGLGSHAKVWWKCKISENHEWQTSVSKRSSGQNCPYCSNKKIGVDNNLAYLNPELAEEWHPTKNGDLKPQHVSNGTKKKVWWKCKKGEDHEWEFAIVNRTKGSGCPYCAKNKKS